ncbi:MAG TPA: acylase, partial [Blastocatellia bacterium]|nr:acylase [Blastocatellia bacterium]
MKKFLPLSVLALLLSNFSMPASAASQGAKPANRQAGLRAEILWDRWGTPHIFARDEESAFRAFGWAQMESHPNLLLNLYGKARGRAAEYFGGGFLASDRSVRTMGLYELAKRWYQEQSPKFRRDLDAFAAGINEYARQNPGRLQGSVKAVLPVDGVDVMAHSARVLYLFLSAVSGVAQALPNGAGLGSNAWAIAPSRSASGNALLLANPHLPWSNEFTFYEAHIAATGYDAYGATLVGFPVLAIAFNDRLGWTHTVNTIDPGDLYELTLDQGGYKLDGKTRPFEVETHTLKVRQPDGSLKEENLTVRRSVHGPVVEKDGKAFALRVAGVQASSFAGALQQWWDMGRAGNFREFEAVIKRLQLPMFNIIYADRDGHISLVFGGQVPVRARGDAGFWLKPVPGDISELLWTKVHAFADLPKTTDPPSGWVQNSNDVPWHMTEPVLDPGKYPAYMSPPTGQLAVNFREQRGIRMVRQDDKISFDELLAYKHSTRSELADHLLDDLIAAANQHGNDAAKKAAEVLRAWDRETDADSRGAALFHAWFQAMGRPGNIFAEAYDPQRPLDTPRGLKDPPSAVRALETAAAQVQAAFGRLDVAWGEACRFRRGKVDLPANGGSGELGIFRVISYRPGKDGRREALGGDSFVAAVEFGNPVKAKVLMTYGNSSEPDSPHYGDQLELAAKKHLRDAWRSRAAIEANLAARTAFNAD